MQIDGNKCEICVACESMRKMPLGDGLRKERAMHELTGLTFCSRRLLPVGKHQHDTKRCISKYQTSLRSQILRFQLIHDSGHETQEFINRNEPWWPKVSDFACL